MKILIVTCIVVLTSIKSEALTDSGRSQCQSPSVDTTLSQEWVEKITPEGGWYFPLISSDESNPEDVLIHRQVPQRNSEEAFCPRMTWKGGEGIFSFYGKVWAIFRCSTNGTYASQACTASDPDSPDSTPEKVNIYFTLTDNNSYLLALRCWDDGHHDWALLNSENNISEATKETVLTHIETLGFDKRAFHEIGYEKC